MPYKHKPVVFLTGASGFVGRAVLDELSKRDVIPIAVYNSARTGSNREIKLDLCDFEKMRSEIDQSGADVLIHCAAKCNVANVSDEKEKARRLNVHCSEKLAEICAEKKLHFVFISTNYVFDGKNPPYSPEASTNPINDYGAQKVEAESKILRVLPSATILRISLQYGDHSELNPSSKNVLDAINSGKTVRLDNLQVRSPTYVKNTAKVICDLALTCSSGVFNYSDGEVMTRFHFALRAAKALVKSYKHITAKTDSPSVVRPHDCSLLSDKLEDIIGLPKVDFATQIQECWGDRPKEDEKCLSEKFSTGEKDVSKLLNSVTPLVEAGLFVFTTSKNAQSLEGVKMIFKEREATTVILPLTVAKTHGLEYTFPSKLITLNIHSSLEAVGFITEISRKLTELKVPCNVVAGYYHDHLFIPEDMVEKALSIFPK